MKDFKQVDSLYIDWLPEDRDGVQSRPHGAAGAPAARGPGDARGDCRPSCERLRPSGPRKAVPPAQGKDLRVLCPRAGREGLAGQGRPGLRRQRRRAAAGPHRDPRRRALLVHGDHQGGRRAGTQALPASPLGLLRQVQLLLQSPRRPEPEDPRLRRPEVRRHRRLLGVHQQPPGRHAGHGAAVGRHAQAGGSPRLHLHRPAPPFLSSLARGRGTGQPALATGENQAGRGGRRRGGHVGPGPRGAVVHPRQRSRPLRRYP